MTHNVHFAGKVRRTWPGGQAAAQRGGPAAVCGAVGSDQCDPAECQALRSAPGEQKSCCGSKTNWLFVGVSLGPDSVPVERPCAQEECSRLGVGRPRREEDTSAPVLGCALRRLGAAASFPSPSFVATVNVPFLPRCLSFSWPSCACPLCLRVRFLVFSHVRTLSLCKQTRVLLTTQVPAEPALLTGAGAAAGPPGPAMLPARGGGAVCRWLHPEERPTDRLPICRLPTVDRIFYCQGITERKTSRWALSRVRKPFKATGKGGGWAGGRWALCW